MKVDIKKIVLFVAAKIFQFFERYFHVHITPVGYYSPIPNTCKLNEEIFEKIYDDKGLDLNVSEQMQNLSEIFPKYLAEYTPSANLGLTLVDSFILYAMIREKKPGLVVEVGSGDSTKIALQALERNFNGGLKTEFIAIEPYPKKHLRTISKNYFKLVEKEVQNIEVERLNSADLLFIDSSHVSKIGSDVNYEILELVPNLKKGAIIHWHDIMFPTNYWRDWTLRGNMFWNESYMLHAFLLFNDSFRVIWASRYMQIYHSEKMVAQFPWFDASKHRCTSFWIQKVK